MDLNAAQRFPGRAGQDGGTDCVAISGWNRLRHRWFGGLRRTA